MKLKYPLLLTLAAFFWGTTFVAQSLGMENMGPFTYLCARSFVGAAAIFVMVLYRDRKGLSYNGTKKDFLKGGFACGFCLFFAAATQQIGVQYTTAGKAGFITVLYIVLVPIFGLLLGKKANAQIWVSVAISTFGLYLLCMKKGDMSIGRGDGWLVACAILFSIQILTVDHFSPIVDPVKMSCCQFLITGILSGIAMFIFETPSWANVFAGVGAILYAGILSSGVAFTLQIVCQKEMDPTVASLIMCLESVFSVLGGWMVLHQVLSTREGTGCLLMFVAIVLAQLPEKKKAEVA